MYDLPIPPFIKKLARAALPDALWLQLKAMQRKTAFRGPGPYSLDEPIILHQVDAEQPRAHFFVDIGAQDGVLGSQTLALAKRGWSGVSYEGDPQLCETMASLYRNLPAVSVRNAFVTPDNVRDLLRNDGVPTEFGFLNLDVDSYDYFILEALLGEFAPGVICVEINEVIPPPIRFSVKFGEKAGWSGDRFQGFSIQMAKDICIDFGYDIANLHYNNLILVKRANSTVTDEQIAAVYDKGYVQRENREKLFPWNAEYDRLRRLSPEEAISELREVFAMDEAAYIIENGRS